jgi:hypothetical protein
MILIIV